MVSLRYGVLMLSLAAGSFAQNFNKRLQAELAAVQMKPGQKLPMQVKAAAVDRSAWTVTADSFQAGWPPQSAIDSDTNTFWHTAYSPTNAPLPHNITIDFKQNLNVNGLVYTPRQDGNSNGNIGQHEVQVSTDGSTWTVVAFGTYQDNNLVKTTPFTTIAARYLRIRAFTEAGNRGPWTSAADISVTTGTLSTGSPASVGAWGPTVEFPLVPVAAALSASNGQLVTWSAWALNEFGGTNGNTQTSTYDPSSRTVSLRTITNTGHDMFCPGSSIDASGNIVVTGGNTAPATSSFLLGSQNWVRDANMTIARGYQSQCTLADGRIFTIGGSWSGGEGGKNGEVYNVGTNQWTRLSGAVVAPMLTADAQGVYRADNHAWLFTWKNNYVFQAGPSKAMNWYGMSGSGSQAGAGNRASDPDSMCGNAVMYDAVNGKILTAGGSPSYQNSQATTNTHVITLGSAPAAPSVQKVASMAYARAFANAVVLPNGQVLVAGGQSYPVPFSDDTAQLIPELWTPSTQTWRSVAPIAAPRTYHSVGILMPDATVFVGGGGLCGNCATNHRDGQFWSPPYLFTSSGARASRPTINSISAGSVRSGSTFRVTMSRTVSSFSLVRIGSTTHTVNTDQRRIPVTGSASFGSLTYTITVPSDSGVSVPGPYMVFAMDSNGVPSVAKIINVTN